MPNRPVIQKNNRLVQKLRTVCLSLAAGALLAGCAAQMAYRDGRDLVAQGKVEEGLARFQEAIARDPQHAEYRAAYLQTRERAMSSYLEQADRLADAGRRPDAEKLYRRALAIDPSSERARGGLRVLDNELRHADLLKEAQAAWDKKEGESAQAKLRAILAENPNHAGALALKRTIAQAASKPPETGLSSAYRKPITIEFKDVPLKQLFEVLSRASGLNFLFDKDVKTDQKTSIFLKNSTVESVVHFTLMTNQLEQQVLDANTILIYPNTQAKQKDYQEMVVKTFFLTNGDAKTVANTLKTILKSRDIVIDEKLNMLIVRDSQEAIRLAEKLVALHDAPEPEVMLEVEILEINRSRLMELGIRWPDSLTLTPLPISGATGATGTLTLRDLRNQNSGTLGANFGSININARKEDGDVNLLANPRIRARNHEKAKIMIGERVPNITTTATSTGFISESINYMDVGLTLNVEPTIYLDNDVAIKISLEVSSIGSQTKTPSGSIAYRIGTRTASTVLRLKDGENQVLAGLINDEERRTGNKVPGLGEFPLLGRLFGSTLDDSQKTEIVLSITPHLVRNIQRPDASQSEFRSGTDSSFRVRSDAVSSAAAAPPRAVPSPGTAVEGAANPAQPPAPSGAPALPVPGSGAASGNAAAPPASAAAAVGAAPSVTGAQLQWQGPAQAKTGSTFTVQLIMQSDQPITSLPAAVNFDSRVLQVISVTEGDFLKQGGAQTSFTSRVDPNGQILLTGTRSGESGATAPGSIANINVRALQPVDGAHLSLLTIAPIALQGRTVTPALPPPYSVQVLP